MPIEQEFYLPIHRILLSNITEKSKIEKTAEWLLCNHKGIKMSTLRQTFRKAGREDLIHDFIEDIDVNVGDTVQSRSTARKGVVKEIKSDGETLVIKWDTGGLQQLAKEQIIILHSNKTELFDKKDFSNAKTPFPGYNKHEKKDRDIKTLRNVAPRDINGL